MQMPAVLVRCCLAAALSIVLAACGGGDGGSAGVQPVAGAPGPERLASEPADCANMLDQPHLTRTELIEGRFADDADLLLRFVHMTDIHIIDDDGAAVIGLAPSDPLLSRFAAAMRLQAEYSDEVLNSMIAGINACDETYPSAFAMVTGDSADITTVAETRRMINNMDGTFNVIGAFESRCIENLPGNPSAAQIRQSCTRYTGRLVADAQTPGLEAGSGLVVSLLRQIPVTRTLVQLTKTEAAALAGNTATNAPGLPPVLRCHSEQPGCANVRLSMPYLVAFGNHDAYLRGTLPFEAPLETVGRLFGRQYLIRQRDFIAEFFYTTTQPGPVGHGFQYVPESRWTDGDARNDGYYAFDAGNGRFRMIVLNTVIDGQHGTPPGQFLVNPFALADGTIYMEQFRWLQAQLAQAWENQQLVVIFSHHPDVTFADSGTLAALAPVGITGAQLDQELASWPNVIAWVAGHTHRNRVRAFVVDQGVGSNGPIAVQVDCKLAGQCAGFWQIETSSLIDVPQQQRMIEIFDNGDGTGTIRTTMLTHGYERSRELARVDNRCQFYLDDLAAVAGRLSDGGMFGICSKGGTRKGQPDDRNLNLIFAMPSFEERT